MAKTIHIRITTISQNIGEFSIYDQDGLLIADNVKTQDLLAGIGYSVDDGTTKVTIRSKGPCIYERTVRVEDIPEGEFYDTEAEKILTGCLWKHLDNQQLYNSFYGQIEPYILEYPFAFQYFDEIVQNVKEYTKVYKYGEDQFMAGDPVNVIETDDIWYNKAIVYNGQQSSGLLELVPKPLHNLKSYNTYPIFNTYSKTITYTKSDNFYQYNTFWNILKDKTQPMFTRVCDNLSVDKELNQSNMDYGLRSFKKESIRAKDLKIRHILDNRSDVHLISQFIVVPNQISYK